ncbi:dimethylhistidine N-methyltransferase [Polynucleobacter sp. SHI8]|uniref:L-histidine N(alpha)-methyltransferase n=1 Tax=unclassified Polynucleobacter TaxID=2640945 RepID=UPI0024915355|nr:MULTISPECIES: L-histidine N(alpha)-methyltransferase [unclassified Polynucleobacter]BDW12280.1 dimethylhistidine N-methyltransferase [Polynucleobacter sp. SHI2]BDW14728.1 dimethylhistidine N-methyltransferase [Polynucleobacter sp. SHI8]
MQKPDVSENKTVLEQQNFVLEIEKGLLAQSASISPKFLYDPLGSHLFTAITLLPEYYPTSTEKNILSQYKLEIAQTIGPFETLIDLGAGNCLKAESLFDFLKPSNYVAIDFSEEYLQDALENLRSKYPDIHMQYLGLDFSQNLIVPSTINNHGRVFFYPGSSIGNFLTSEALTLLTQIKEQAGDGGLLIGVDLMKDDLVLKAAYDDDLKVTAAFNLNILRSINAIIGSNFNVSQFRHKVIINHSQHRVELYLEALEDLLVSWSGNHRFFKKGELIHTENSHKYAINSIQQLLEDAGFKSTKIWKDPKDYFAVIYAN